MSVSFEALAMAGIDSNEWAMDAEEWERNEMENDVPPHLLADEDDDGNENVLDTASTSNYEFPATRFLHRKVDGAGGAYCSPKIICHFRKIIEKRALNCLSSMGIIVRAIVGFFMVMTMKIIISHDQSPNKN